MDVSALERNPQKIHEALMETPDAKLVAKKACKIYIPTRYVDKEIAWIGERILIPAVYGIVVDDRYYGTSIATAMMEVTPDSMQETLIDDDKYWEFSFDKGSVICPNLNLLRKDTYAYGLWEDIASMGKHPWYWSAYHHSQLLNTTGIHADIRVISDGATMELITAYLTRNNDDLFSQFRHVAKNHEDLLDKSKSVILALNDVSYVAPDTLSKLTGAYLDQGLTAALVDHSDQLDTAERIYRMNVK